MVDKYRINERGNCVKVQEQKTEPEARKNAPPKAPPVTRHGPSLTLEPSGPIAALDDNASHFEHKSPPALTGNLAMDDMIEKCLSILRVKGNDYTLGKNDKDRLHNFKMAAEFVGVRPEQALGIYFYKHIAAVFNFIRGDHSESEPIEGRIADSINYMLLFTIMIKEMRGNKA